MLEHQNYKHGFVTHIKSIKPNKGLSEEIVNYISKRKCEPSWMLEKRLLAYYIWLGMKEPNWAKIKHLNINLKTPQYYENTVTYTVDFGSLQGE